jgi:hypothetical protein
MVAGRRVLGKQRQGDPRDPLVPAEGIRLVLPVHVARRPRIAIQVVLGLLVVTQNCFRGGMGHVAASGL